LEARSAADGRAEQHVAAAATSGGRQGLLELFDAVHAVAAVDGTFHQLLDVLAQP
jgi:hypothetical protein